MVRSDAHVSDPPFRLLPGDRPLRALLVGAGAMGRAWAHNLETSADVELVGWVDLVEDTVRREASELRGPDLWVGTELTDGIETVRPDFVVDVATPEAHCGVTLTAFAHGLPVLGEKPLAASLAEAHEMIRAAEETGLLLMVSQNRRYDENLRTYVSQVRRIGPLGLLISEFAKAPHFGGFREEMESPLITDMAIHTFDSARYICGAEPGAVYCDEFNPPWSWYRGDAAGAAIFEMSNGMRYIYTGCWCADGFETAWAARWRAVGPKGTALWEGEGSRPRVDVVPDSSADLDENNASSARETLTTSRSANEGGSAAPPLPNGIAGSLAEFVLAVRTGRIPMGECHDNLMSLAMVGAAVESSRSGRRVLIEDVIELR